MKITVKDIILILIAIIFAYLWLSKPVQVNDNSQHEIDSLNIVISRANDSINAFKKETDSLKAANLKNFFKIRELNKDKADLLEEYEKTKGHIISNSVDADLDYFTKHISTVDNRWK